MLVGYDNNIFVASDVSKIWLKVSIIWYHTFCMFLFPSTHQTFQIDRANPSDSHSLYTVSIHPIKQIATISIHHASFVVHIHQSLSSG